MGPKSTTKLSFSQLRPKLQQLMTPHLSTDDIILCFETVDKIDCIGTVIDLLSGNGFTGNTYWGIAISRKKVARGIYSGGGHEVAESINIVDITNVQPYTDVGGAYSVNVFGSGSTKMILVFGDKVNQQNFVNTLQRVVDDAKNKISARGSNATRDVKSRLKELTSLRDEGLIDEAEYQSKRRKILGEI